MREPPLQSGKKMSGWLVKGLAIPLVLSVSLSIAATNHQSLASIRDVVEQFVADELGAGEDVKAVLGHLDTRLRLHQCAKPLTAFWPNGSSSVGRGVVGVKCEADKPWKMYVQVNLHVFKNVAVIKHPKIRGEVLFNEDIAYKRMDISRLGDRFLIDVEPILGYELKRSVNPGTVLHSRLFAVPKIIKRGERVVILAQAGGIEVKMNGRALSDGVRGSVIKVKNLSSSRVVEGEVIGKGTVKIRF